MPRTRKQSVVQVEIEKVEEPVETDNVQPNKSDAQKGKRQPDEPIEATSEAVKELQVGQVESEEASETDDTATTESSEEKDVPHTPESNSKTQNTLTSDAKEFAEAIGEPTTNVPATPSTTLKRKFDNMTIKEGEIKATPAQRRGFFARFRTPSFKRSASNTSETDFNFVPDITAKSTDVSESTTTPEASVSKTLTSRSSVDSLPQTPETDVDAEPSLFDNDRIEPSTPSKRMRWTDMAGIAVGLTSATVLALDSMSYF